MTNYRVVVELEQAEQMFDEVQVETNSFTEDDMDWMAVFYVRTAGWNSGYLV